MSTTARARSLYASGRLPEAAAMLTEILRRTPTDADAMQLLGVIDFQSGRRREGLHLAEQAVSLDPSNAEAWNNLGLMRHMNGDPAGALAAFVRATETNPLFETAWKHKGFVLQGDSRHEEALTAFVRAGDHPDVHFFRGNSLAALGRQAEALAEFERVIEQESKNGDAWHNRGNALVALGRPREGVESIKEALKWMAPASQPHCSLAAALMAAGRHDEALSVIDVVLKWDPTLARARELRIMIESALREMAAHASRLADIPDKDLGAIQERADLARVLQAQGKWREAVGLLSTAKNGGLRVLEALLLPPIFESSDAAGEALAHLEFGLANLEASPPRVDDPHRQVGITTFSLPYFGVSDRPYQERIARMYRQASELLRFEASHSPGKGRTRLGIVSALLTEHTVSRVFGGLIERFDRSRFETVFLQIGTSDADSEKLGRSVDRHVQLTGNLGAVQEQIAKEELDMLFFPEIGMDPLTYYLSFSRFAPVQVTTWGHPLTTGSPTMDYFVSSKHLERDDGQAEYSERLMLLPNLTTFYSRPESPPPWPLSDYGLPTDRRLYGCPQMPYKFHPDYDRVLASILERDDKGSLVLIEPQRAFFKQILIERWRRTHPILVERTIWLHLMPLDRFLRLLQLCDALLAPIQFGAGRSTLDAFGVGAPVVTFKGRYLKSRITYAAYKEIGFEDLIANSEEEYVDLAHRLAKDDDFRSSARRSIQEKSEALFESGAAVQELNDLMSRIAPGGS